MAKCGFDIEVRYSTEECVCVFVYVFGYMSVCSVPIHIVTNIEREVVFHMLGW